MDNNKHAKDVLEQNGGRRSWYAWIARDRRLFDSFVKRKRAHAVGSRDGGRVGVSPLVSRENQMFYASGHLQRTTEALSQRSQNFAYCFCFYIAWWCLHSPRSVCSLPTGAPLRRRFPSGTGHRKSPPGLEMIRGFCFPPKASAIVTRKTAVARQGSMSVKEREVDWSLPDLSSPSCPGQASSRHVSCPVPDPPSQRLVINSVQLGCSSVRSAHQPEPPHGGSTRDDLAASQQRSRFVPLSPYIFLHSRLMRPLPVHRSCIIHAPHQPPPLRRAVARRF